MIFSWFLLTKIDFFESPFRVLGFKKPSLKFDGIQKLQILLVKTSCSAFIIILENKDRLRSDCHSAQFGWNYLFIWVSVLPVHGEVLVAGSPTEVASAVTAVTHFIRNIFFFSNCYCESSGKGNNTEVSEENFSVLMTE